MYMTKLGINMDDRDCLIVSDSDNPTYPVPWKTEAELKKLMAEPSAVNITEKYNTVLFYNIITYAVLDLNIIYTLLKYRDSVVN